MQRFTQVFGKQHIATMASGGQPPNFRFYFHAQPASGSSRILVELIVSTSAASIAATLKSDAPGTDVVDFSQRLTEILSSM